jgi:DNA processing protein
MDQERLSLIRLVRSEGVGQVTLRQLLTKYKTAKNAVENFKEFAQQYKLTNKIFLIDTQVVTQELEDLEKMGGKLITFLDPQYPKLLKQLHDYPFILSVIGNHELLKLPSIAVVGSRNASANGYRYGHMLSQQIVGQGYVVVSGLARGIDTAAHRGSGGKTIACLAGGVDFIYPPENKLLYEEIKEHGLLVSEMALGTTPKASNFPMRNRIISGLSEAVIVVEAAINSGSLITARFALEQNRDIYAVPSFPGDPRARGVLKLLKEGAYIMEDFSDYKKSYYQENVDEFTDEIDILSQKEEIKLSLEPEICESERIVLQQISSSPVSLDEIVEVTSLSINNVLSVISKFELEGKIMRQSGNKVVLVS